MISTDEALAHLFALVPKLGTEEIPLSAAHGRVLAEDLVATRFQPPFAASAMDGYALAASDRLPGRTLRVIGEAPAGRAFQGTVKAGEAVRIFTGAPLPPGSDTVVIQEDTVQSEGHVTLSEALSDGDNVRPAGGDFEPGARVSAPRRLSPSDIALAAAMNIPKVVVRKRPVVAILATGDELVQPGERPAEDQIIASNALGLKALLTTAGASARLLPIARDTVSSLRTALALANSADLIVTIGGASVGDHDLVGDVALDLGMERAFYKIAMRPGKPLMAGRLAGSAMIGLPGNPVSSMVCGQIFILPFVRAALGFPAAPRARHTARLGADVSKNGPREHYMRARYEAGVIIPFSRQDSSLLTVLSEANALLVRPPHDPSRGSGDTVTMIPLSPSASFD